MTGTGSVGFYDITETKADDENTRTRFLVVDKAVSTSRNNSLDDTIIINHT